MTTPTIIASPYQGNSTDYLKAPVDRGGAMRLVSNSVTIPTATATNTFIGMVPFQKGARFGYGSRVFVTDIDSSTNVTLDVGYVYDDNVTYTNDEDAFVAAATTGQAGGMMEMTAVAGMTWTAEADGWIVTQVNIPNTTTGTLTWNLNVGYDG